MSKALNTIDPADFDFSRTTLNPDKIGSMAEVLRSGGTRGTACGRAGISERTFRRWMAQGAEESEMPEADRSKYYWFYRMMEAAMSEAKRKLDDRMIEAGKNDWRMWAWRAERLYPQDYRKQQDVTVEERPATRESREITEEDRAFLKQMFGTGDPGPPHCSSEIEEHDDGCVRGVCLDKDT